MYVSVAIVRAIADGLVHRGVSLDQLAQRADFQLHRLADPTSMVTVVEYGRLIRAALALSGAPAFALEVGGRAPTGALHTVGYLLLNCRTMRDAIEQFVELASLVFEGARWELTEADKQARFSYRHELLHDDIARFDAEFCLAFVLGVGRHFSGPDAAPLEVRFAHPAPCYRDEYTGTFCAPVSFDQPRTEIVFSRAVLDEPQLHRDEAVAELLRQRAQRLLARRNSDGLLVERVVDFIKYQLDVDAFEPAQLCHQLGMSPRTLRRRLSAAGVTLSTLVDRARCEVARTALAGQAPIKEIAERLGFSETSAFHRAFKRWTGWTPARYRAMVVAHGGAAPALAAAGDG